MGDSLPFDGPEARELLAPPITWRNLFWQKWIRFLALTIERLFIADLIACFGDMPEQAVSGVRGF